MEKYVKNYNAPISNYSIGRSGTKVVNETRKLLVYDKRQQMLVLGLVFHEKFQCFFTSFCFCVKEFSEKRTNLES